MFYILISFFLKSGTNMAATVDSGTASGSGGVAVGSFDSRGQGGSNGGRVSVAVAVLVMFYIFISFF
jgi:hypothetical protein